MFRESQRSLVRFLSFLLSLVLFDTLYLFPFFGNLQAQASYQNFDQFGSQQMQPYTESAADSLTMEEWEEQVGEGLLAVFSKWEISERKKLDAELDEAEDSAEQAELKSEFDAARESWLEAAHDQIVKEKIDFFIKQENVTVSPPTSQELISLVSAANEAVLSSENLDLSTWDAVISCGADLSCGEDGNRGLERIRSLFSQEVDDRLALVEARGSWVLGDSEDESVFTAALGELEKSLWREYNTREYYYVRRARNSYIATETTDDASLRLSSEQESAQFITDNLIASALEDARDLADTLLSLEDFTGSEGISEAEFESLGEDWESRVEAVISQGLDMWGKAEEDLLKSRLEWAADQNQLLEDGGALWKEGYEEIVSAKEAWLAEIQEIILDGRAQWDQKIADFSDERSAAEAELARFIESENEKWASYNGKLSEFVSTGATALTQAREAIDFYTTELENSAGTSTNMTQFYQQERDAFITSVSTFMTLLNDVRSEMNTTMNNTDGNAPGYLYDRREYAGALWQEIHDWGVNNFADKLQEALNTDFEDVNLSSDYENFVLYDKDLRELLYSSAHDSERAAALFDIYEDFPGDDYSDDWSGLLSWVNSLGHEDLTFSALFTSEISRIVNEIADDAERKTALEAYITEILTDYQDSDQLLFNRVSSYFKDAAEGYYLTSNSGDAYLMSDVELEWEMLRNERNYWNRQLSQAQAVYDYAVKVESSSAAAEIASLTQESYDAAHAWSELSFIKYQLLKGDITLADTDALNALLSSRDVDWTELMARKASLGQEVSDLEKLRDEGGVDEASDLDSLISALEKYNVSDGDGEEHYLKSLYSKLVSLKAGWGSVSQAASLSEFAVLQGAAEDILEELVKLEDAYSFSESVDDHGLEDEYDDIADNYLNGRSLVDIQNDLDASRDQIESLSNLAQQAMAEYQSRQEAYDQARKIYMLSFSEDAQKQAMEDLKEAGSRLGELTNRSETLTAIGSLLQTKSLVSEIEYYDLLASREQAENEQNFYTQVLNVIEDYESSAARLSAYESLTIVNADFTDMSIEQIVSELTSTENKEKLYSESEGWSTTNSYYNSLTGLVDSLDEARVAYENRQIVLAGAVEEEAVARTNYETALAANEAKTETDKLYSIWQGKASSLNSAENSLNSTLFALLATENALVAGVDGFVLSLKAEKEAKQLAMDSMLGLESVSLWGTEYAEIDSEVLSDYYNELGEFSATENARIEVEAGELLQEIVSELIAQFEAGSRDRISQADVMKEIASQMAALYGTTLEAIATDAEDPNTAKLNYEFGLYLPVEGAELSHDLAVLQTLQSALSSLTYSSILRGLSVIPPPENDKATEGESKAAHLKGWQDFLEELEEQQKSSVIYQEITAEKTKENLGNWESEYRTQIENIINDLTGIIDETDSHGQYTTYLKNLDDPEGQYLKQLSLFYLGYAIDGDSDAEADEDLTRLIDSLNTSLFSLRNNRSGVWNTDSLLNVSAEIAVLEEKLKDISLTEEERTGLEKEKEKLELRSLGIYSLPSLSRFSSFALEYQWQDSLYSDELTYVSERLYVGEAALSLESGDWYSLENQMKAALGVYETDEYGNIKLDENGNPVYGAGYSETNSDLTSLTGAIGGDKTGEELLSWAEDIEEMFSGKQVPDSLAGALTDLQAYVIQYKTALEMVRYRNGNILDDVENTLHVDGDDTTNSVMDDLEERLEKLEDLLGFVSSLNSAFSLTGETNGVSNILHAIIGLSESQNVLELFSDWEAYKDTDNTLDTYAGAEDFSAADNAVYSILVEIFAFADDARALRDEQAGLMAFSDYADLLASGSVLSAEDYFEESDVFNTTTAQEVVNSIADAEFTLEAVFEAIESSVLVSDIERSLIIQSYLEFDISGATPAGIKAAILTRLEENPLRTQWEDAFALFYEQDYFLNSLDVTIADSMDDYIDSYTTRSEYLVGALQVKQDGLESMNLSEALGYFEDFYEVLSEEFSDEDPVNSEHEALLLALESVLADTYADATELGNAFRSAINDEITDDVTTEKNELEEMLERYDVRFAKFDDSKDVLNLRGDLRDFIDEYAQNINANLYVDYLVRVDNFADEDESADAGAFLTALAEETALIAPYDWTDTSVLETFYREGGLSDALTLYTTSAFFEIEDYPAELRGFIVARGYTLARQAYEDYQSDPEKKSLSLLGHPEEIASIFYLEDFAGYMEENSLVDFLSENPGASIDDYLRKYAESRNTLVSYIGEGFVANATNLLLRSEKARLDAALPAAADIAGWKALDADNYLSEFTQSIVLQKFTVFLTESGDWDSDAGTADETVSDYLLRIGALDPGTFELDLDIDSGEWENLWDTFVARYSLGDLEGTDESYTDYLGVVVHAYLEEEESDRDLSDYLATQYSLYESTYSEDYADELDLAAIKDTSDLLPPELTAIAGYATLTGEGYMNLLSGEEYKELYSKSLLSGMLLVKHSGEYMNDEALAAFVDEVNGEGGYSFAAGDYLEYLRVVNLSGFGSDYSSFSEALSEMRFSTYLKKKYDEEDDGVNPVLEQLMIDPDASADYQGALKSLNRIAQEAFDNQYSFADGMGNAGYASLEEQYYEDPVSFIVNALRAAVNGTAANAYEENFKNLFDELGEEQKTALLNLLEDEDSDPATKGEKEIALEDYLAEASAFNLIAGQDLESARREVAGLSGFMSDEAAEIASENFSGFFRLVYELSFMSAGTLSDEAQVVLDKLVSGGLSQGELENLISDKLSESAEIYFKTHATQLSEFFAFIGENADMEEALFDARYSAKASAFAASSLRSELSLSISENSRSQDSLISSLQMSVSGLGEKLNESADNSIESLQVAYGLLDYATSAQSDSDINNALSTFGDYRTYLWLYDQTETQNFQEKEGKYVLYGDENYNLMSTGFWDTTLSTLRSDSVVVGESFGSGDDQVDGITHRVISHTDGNSTLMSAHLASVANNYLSALTDLNQQIVKLLYVAHIADGSQVNEDTDGNISGVRQTAYNEFIAENSAAINSYKNSDRNIGDVEILKAALDLSGKIAERQNEIENEYSGAELTEGRNNINRVRTEVASTKSTFVKTGLLNLSIKVQAESFIEGTFKTVANERSLLENEYNARVAALNAEKEEYSGYNREYAETLSKMGESFRFYENYRTIEEERLEVLDYASTPYLSLISSEEGGNANPADALARLERAQAGYDVAQEAFAEASERVRTQTTLDDLHAVIEDLNDGDDLSGSDPDIAEIKANGPGLNADGKEVTDEEVQEIAWKAQSGIDLKSWEEEVYDNYTLLKKHEIYTQYKEYIEERREYIEESYRYVRLERTASVLRTEIDKRQAIAEKAKQEYEAAKSAVIAVHETYKEDKAAIARRDAMVKYLLANKGDLNTALEMYRFQDKSVIPYEKMQLALAEDGTLVINKNNLHQNAMVKAYQALSSGDQELLQSFENMNGNQLNFNSYGTYESQMNQVKSSQDTVYLMKIEQIAKVVTGGIMVGSGLGMVAKGVALIAASMGFGSAAGVAWIASGGVLITIGKYTIDDGNRNYKKAADDLKSKERARDSTVNSLRKDLDEVETKQKEYMEALAKLEYFTKAAGEEILIERLVQYGRSNEASEVIQTTFGTTRAYALREEDIRYLFAMVNDEELYFNGSDGITEDEKEDALDVSEERERKIFADVDGNFYDPHDILYSDAGLELQGGFYLNAGGEKYIKINLVTNHNFENEMTVAYAKVISEAQAIEDIDAVKGSDDYESWDGYNLSNILEAAVTHSMALRQEKKDTFFANRADENLEYQLITQDIDEILSENLLAYAAGESGDYEYYSAAGVENPGNEGGYEYYGYQTLWGDYMENADAAFSRVQQQNLILQTQVWDIRQSELYDKRDAWENKMMTILNRGAGDWMTSVDRYRKQWVDWERKSKQAIKDKEKEWDEKMAAFLLEKEEWMENAQDAGTEEALERLLGESGDKLNARLKALAAGIGGTLDDLALIDVEAAKAAAWAEYQENKPDSTDTIKNINENISRFNTTLALTEMTSFSGLSDDTLSVRFAEAQDDFNDHLKAYANAQAMKQLVDMVGQFKESLKKMQESYRESLANSAMGFGYNYAGGLFGKRIEYDGYTKNYKFREMKKADVDEVVDLAFQVKFGTTAEELPVDEEYLLGLIEDKNQSEFDIYVTKRLARMNEVFDHLITEAEHGDAEDIWKDTREDKDKGQFERFFGEAPEIDVTENHYTIEDPGLGVMGGQLMYFDTSAVAMAQSGGIHTNMGYYGLFQQERAAYYEEKDYKKRAAVIELTGEIMVSVLSGGAAAAALSTVKALQNSTLSVMTGQAELGSAIGLGLIQAGTGFVNGAGLVGGIGGAALGTLAGGFQIGDDKKLQFGFSGQDWASLATSMGAGYLGGAFGSTGSAVGTYAGSGITFGDNWEVGFSNESAVHGMANTYMSGNTGAKNVTNALITSSFGSGSFDDAYRSSAESWSSVGSYAGNQYRRSNMTEAERAAEDSQEPFGAARELFGGIGAWASRRGRGIKESFMEGYNGSGESASSGSGGGGRGFASFGQNPLSELFGLFGGGGSGGGETMPGIGEMLISALGLEYASGLVSGIYHGIGNVAQDAWYGAGDLIKKGASATWGGITKGAKATWGGITKGAKATWGGITKGAKATWGGIKAAMKYLFTADEALSPEELKTIQEKMQELHADGKLTKEEMQAFLNSYVDRSNFDKVTFDDKNGSFGLESKSYRFMGLFGSRTESLEFFQREGHEATFNEIRNERNFWNHLFLGDRTFINGTELKNGDAFIRNLSGALSVIDQRDLQQRFKDFASEDKTFHFTQNGMNTNGLGLVGMDERAQHLLANDYAAGLDGSVGVYNETNRLTIPGLNLLLGSLPVGDAINHGLGRFFDTEKAVDSWAQIAASGILANENSDAVGHSQGADILMRGLQKFYNNPENYLDISNGETAKTTLANIFLIGGAQRFLRMPERSDVPYVNSFRNTGIGEPVPEINSSTNPNGGNWHTYSQSDGGWSLMDPGYPNSSVVGSGGAPASTSGGFWSRVGQGISNFFTAQPGGRDYAAGDPTRPFPLTIIGFGWGGQKQWGPGTNYNQYGGGSSHGSDDYLNALDFWKDKYNDGRLGGGQ